MDTKRTRLSFIKARLSGLVLLLLVIGCGSAKKGTASPTELAYLKELIAGKSFKFIAIRAHPMPSQAFNAVANSGILPPGSNAGVIDLSTTANFVEVLGDSISGNLPFYGERRFSAGPGTQSGIRFEDIAKSYKANFNTKQQRYDIQITVQGEQELFELQLNAFPSGRTDLSVMSNHRTTIRYEGRLEPLEATSE